MNSPIKKHIKCWKPLKPNAPQRGDEISSSAQGCENRKKRLDGARLNPKHQAMGNQQDILEQRTPQRLPRERAHKRVQTSASVKTDDDIV